MSDHGHGGGESRHGREVSGLFGEFKPFEALRDATSIEMLTVLNAEEAGEHLANEIVAAFGVITGPVSGKGGGGGGGGHGGGGHH